MPVSLYKRIKNGEMRVTNFSPPMHRFWASTNKEGPVHPIHGRCWSWIPPKTKGGKGYGQFTVAGRNIRAHRFAYETFVCKIPADAILLHMCDNGGCVNPKHLQIGTHQTNQADKVAKNRQAKGETNGYSKFTEEQIREIRRRHALKRGYHDPVNGQGALAKEFRTSQPHISDIVSRKVWKHI